VNFRRLARCRSNLIEEGISHNGISPVRRAALRLVALIVLFSGAADYSAFDVGDPLAPMSAAGTSGFVGPDISHQMSKTAVGRTDTQDDGCIGCAAGFTVHQAAFLHAVVIATMNVLPARHPSDPQILGFDPPPRA
jgi:hypothetical protein